ncbi:MAG: SPOR domain-containing protein [Betaproteobacteria bacterium]
MRTLFFLLLLANLTLFGFIKLDSMSGGEAVRLSQQVQPDRIKLLTPQQVAALGPAKVAALADVCVEWGPMSDAERVRALSTIEPLDLGRLITQRKVEVIASYWLFLPPAATKAAADRRVDELKAQGIREATVIDSGTQRLAISLGAFRTEDAAQSRLNTLQAQGVKNARVAQRTQSVQQTALVVRDPPAPAVVRLKELQGGFPGTEVKIGTCERTS